MKIVYILEQFYLHGGAEKTISHKANWLVSNGYDITIISNFQNNKPYIYPLDKEIKFIDLNINYNRKKSYFNPINILKSPKHIYKLKKVLNIIKPDIIIDLSLQFDYYALPFITTAKTIREFHSSRYNYDTRLLSKSYIKKIIYKLNDYIEQKYNALVVLTPDELKHYKTNNTYVIPNGIFVYNDENYFTEREKIVIAAGRLAPVKNFEELIVIWKKISREFQDWKLNIYGGGDKTYFNKLMDLIIELNIEKNVCLCGETKILLDEMKKASIYAMTSLTECYPMVLLEAKSVGLPVISYDCPYGPRNIIQNNIDGLLIENKNQTDFEKAIKKLMIEKKLRLQMNQNAKNRIFNFSHNMVMNKWLNLFGHLIN